MQYREANPYNDYLFKYIFGDNSRKQVTLNFINSILELNSSEQLTDIEFINHEIIPDTENGKLSRLDIFGQTNDKTKINIEVQVVNEKNIEKRTLYYWTKMYTIKSGEKYQNLHRAITINLLKFNILPHEKFHSMYGVYDIESGHRLNRDLEIHFLEQPKWKITSIKEMKRLDRWMAYFSNQLSQEEMEEISMIEPTIAEALKAESVFMQDDIARREYEQREKAIRDYESAIDAYWNEGFQQGAHENAIRTALNMLQLGLPIDIIAKSTNLSIDEIKKIKI